MFGGMYRAGAIGALAALACACHTVTRTEITRPSETTRVRLDAAPAAGAPQLVLAGARLRFVEPLACATEEVVTDATALEVATRPNLATFAVGALAALAGGVLAGVGLAGERPGESPLVYAGLGALAAGLPFAIGPWLGTRVDLVETPATRTRRQPGPPEPCGDRALAARAATLAVNRLEIHGAVDRDGAFAVSPFQFVDAFETDALALAITAAIDTPAGARTATAVLEAAALAAAARRFLDAADFDAAIQPMRAPPVIVAGTLRISLTSTADGPAIRVVLPLRNKGAGPAYALRGHVVARAAPAIDGRMIYVGHLPRGAAVSRELLVPITEAAAAELRHATLDVDVELRDAHGAAPPTPVRFRSAVLVDAPR